MISLVDLRQLEPGSGHDLGVDRHGDTTLPEPEAVQQLAHAQRFRDVLRLAVEFESHPVSTVSDAVWNFNRSVESTVGVAPEDAMGLGRLYSLAP